MSAGPEGNDPLQDYVGVVVELRRRDPAEGADVPKASTAPRQADLRFLNGPRGDVNGYRISALFETEPELDGIVGAMIRNGFRYIADLHAARVADVFAHSDARLDERRRVIERLRTCANLKLVS